MGNKDISNVLWGNASTYWVWPEVINYRGFGRSSAVETDGNHVLSDGGVVGEEGKSKQFLRDHLSRIGEKKLAANVAFKHHSSRGAGYGI